ncbi:MAG: hypothetical protein KGL44_09615 [Sphingomonadales bacterium]|nr:hypothetical protein [Sphingomonadales bacterium]
MHKCLLIPALVLGAFALPASPALADQPELKTLLEQQVGQWADPRTAPETRTRCRGTSKGVWPWGGKWQACKEWQTNVRVMEVYATLNLRGPKDLPKPEKALAESCGRLAAAAASQVNQPETGPAQAAATTTFTTCAGNNGLAAPERFQLAVETRNSWSDWH